MSNLSVYEALDYLSPELRDSAFNYLTKLPEEFAKLEGRFDELQNSNPQCSFPLLLLSMAIASSRAAHARDVAQYTIEDLPESKKLIEDIREYTKRPRTTASQESKISRSLVTCFNAQLGIDVTFGDFFSTKTGATGPEIRAKNALTQRLEAATVFEKSKLSLTLSHAGILEILEDSQPDVKGGFQLLKERYPHCASDWVLVLIAQHVKIIDRSNSGIAETAKYLSIKTTHLAENYAKRVIETTLRGTRIESGVSLFTAVAKEFSKKSWRDVAPKSLIEFHPVIGEQLTINEINKLDPEPYDLREPSGLLRKPQNIRQALYLVDNLFAWNSPVLSFKSWLARESLHVNDRQHLGVFGIIFRARYKGIDLEEHELNEFMRGEIPLSKQGKPVEILTKIAKLMGEEFTSERLLAEANISIGSAASFSPKGPRPRAG